MLRTDTTPGIGTPQRARENALPAAKPLRTPDNAHPCSATKPRQYPRCHGDALSNVLARAVLQRALSEDDKQLLIAYAQQKLGTTDLPVELVSKINGWAKFHSELTTAKKDVDWALRKRAFKGAKQHEYAATTSLTAWTERPIFACQTVGMTASATATEGGSRFILATQSLRGCLGVAAYGQGRAFLSHWIPSQLKPALIEDRIREISKAIGTSGVLHLSSASMNTNPEYIVDFRTGIQGTQYQIANEYANERLAINANTGAVMIDFDTKDILGD